MPKTLDIIHLNQEALKHQSPDTHGSPYDLGQFIFVNLPIGIFRSTPESSGKYLLANPALSKMFGYSDLGAFLKIPVRETYWNPKDRRIEDGQE